MAQTDLDVCNLSLSRIGAETIDALNEETPAGAFCMVQYPEARDWLLSKYRWAFANRVGQLNQMTETPADCPAPYAFALPADLVGAIFAYRTAASRVNGAPVRAEMANGYIACDRPGPLWGEYTGRVSPAQWPTWFLELVKIAFASSAASGVALNQQLAQSLYVQAFGTPDQAGEGGLYAQARNEDSRNAPRREAFPWWDDGPLVNARFAYGPYAGAFGGNSFIYPPNTIGPISFIDFSDTDGGG